MRIRFFASVAALSIFIHSARSGCAGIIGSASASDPFWMKNGGLSVASKSAYNPGYKVFRNVKTDYHAVGDGIADDTDAINKAIADGGRCGQGCFSSTITPAIIFFPPGKYRVTKPIIPFYYTSLVGDYKSKPTLVADANFQGIAVIDADPYIPGEVGPDGNGVNWWTNQNNFFRSVRNFVIDVTAMPPDQFGTGIHWQVGQATSLINIDFKMSKAAGTKHQGVFMENGSGGFMSDLTFDGGAFGMWISNQQFTIRNVKITNAVSAIYQQWNWGFTWQNIQISNCQVGFDLNTGGLTQPTQSAGGVLIVDSSISGTGIGIRMSSSQPSSLAGSVILDNVKFTGISTANIQDSAGTVVAANAANVPQWFQGNVYLGSSKRYLRGAYTPSGSRPNALIDGSGAFFSRSRPQYETYKDIQFFSIMAIGLGAKGDGVSDDTVAINTFLSKYSGCAILIFETGTYLVTDTIFVPAGTKIVGNLYAVIMGSGPNFADQKNPRPVIQVGNPGDVGEVEMSDLVITTTGGSAGAIGIEWNLRASAQGTAGLWDVHIRLGGAKGTNINAANCPTSSTDATKCASAFLGLHITKTGSGYFENVWVWNADHDLDDPNQTQINVFSGRGILVESALGPVWLVGTASEHHVIYQYAFNNAQNVWAGLIQTETPYFQPTPKPPTPFAINPTYGDPAGASLDAWGLVVTNSFQIYVYGAGLYSFFQTYSQACVPNRNCQDSMILVDSRSAGIYLYQLTTAGTTNMITYTGGDVVALQADNINGFASTLSFWEADGDGSGGPGDSGSGGFDSFSDIPWNPNPYPSPGAASETFVGAISSVVVAIPTTTVFVTVGGAIITLNSGGTPVNALIPSTISEPNAITPTWTFNILPPTSVPSITFTAPLSGAETFSTVVPSPTTGAVTITGPAGAVWTLTAGSSGASILGTLPTSIGISGGTTPTAVPPVGWLGPWTDPIFPHSVTTMQPVQSNTEVPWNPNPFPPPGATSETFICAGTTTSFPIPTATKTISAGGATIVLNSGGTPVNGPLASQCTEVAGILPSWSQDIIPPPGASIITFTGPLTSTPTWLTTVPVPPKSDSPEATATGPPGDKNRCNDLNFWSLLFGLIIHPCLPLDVGIIGGITPVPIPPPGWSGPWTNPIPRPTPPPPGGGDDDQTTSQASSSSSSDAACPTKPANLDLPDDDDNADWDDEGSDPDERRRDVQIIPRVPAARRSLQEFNATYDLQRINTTHSHLLFRRNRHIKIANCDALEIDSPTNVLLGEGNYITLDPRRANWETILISQAVRSKPTVAGETNQEHVFELGYISQFTNAAPINADCDWIRENLFDYVRADGTTMGIAIIRTIDSVDNMVWVDKPLNQAKSNVVNQNSADAAHPPQLVPLRLLLEDGEFDNDAQEIYSVEDFLRHLAAVGQYFGGTAPIFREIALRVQDLLSEITPSDVIDGDSSIPLQFNNWLTNLVNTYPNGCTSRGQNAWNYYVNAMNAISLREQRPVPACYELFSHGTYNPSTFNPQNLLPPPPQSPRCNVPGTAGAIAYVQSVPAGTLAPVGVLQFGSANGAVQIMGSGNTDFYAVGSGTSIGGSHVQGLAIDPLFDSCAGSYIFDDVPPGTAGYSTANIAFVCHGLGAQDVTINFRVKGVTLPTCTLVRHDGNSPWRALCSPAGADHDECLEEYVLDGGLRRRVTLDPVTLDISSLEFAIDLN